MICTNRQILPKPAVISKEYDHEWSWGQCEEFVRMHCAHIPRAPLPEQTQYAAMLGISQESADTGMMYSRWSMTSEVQLLSRRQDDEPEPSTKDILSKMGRGQAPMFHWKPICPKKGQHEFRCNPVIGHLSRIKALLAQRHTILHPTRGREVSQEATSQNARSLARMQEDLDTWPD